MSDNPANKFFGGLLIAVGVLIAALSGLCSLGLVASSIGSVLRGPAVGTNLTMGLVMVGIFGGVPFLFGVAMIVGGRAMMKPSVEPRPVPPPSYGQDPPDGPPRADL